AAERESLRVRPGDLATQQRLAYLLLLDQRYAESLALYRAIAGRTPANPYVWESMALCAENLGDPRAASAALERALALAESAGDSASGVRLRQRLAGLRPPVRG